MCHSKNSFTSLCCLSRIFLEHINVTNPKPIRIMITIIPRINQQNYIQSKTRTAKKQSVNFKGYTTLFSKELDKVLKNGRPQWKQEQKLVNLLNEVMGRKIKSANLIGEGHYGRVYKLDSKYVLKVLDKEQIFSGMLTGLSRGKFKNLKTYYGEHIAEFEDVYVLKNLSPHSLHMPVGVPQKFSKVYSQKDCENYYAKVYLPLFAKIPQKSYNAIAKDCKELNKMSNGEYFLNFDYCNPNNFVLYGKSLRITDDIYNTSLENPNTAADLLEVFLDKMSRTETAPNLDDQNALYYRREILKKLVIAANNCKLPLGDNISCCEGEWKYILNKICKIKSLHFNVLENLKAMQAEIPDRIRCVNATKKYMDAIIKESGNV